FGTYGIQAGGTTPQSFSLAMTTVDPNGIVESKRAITDNGAAEQYQIVLGSSDVLGVLQAVTTTTVSSDHSSGSIYGQSFTFSATVNAVGAGTATPTPTGRVQF